MSVVLAVSFVGEVDGFSVLVEVLQAASHDFEPGLLLGDSLGGSLLFGLFHLTDSYLINFNT